MSQKKRAERLAALVETQLEQHPYSLDGHNWAAAPQEWWAEQLGASVATVKRLIAAPPFVRKRVQIDGKQVTLLRVGTPGPKTQRDYANIMSAIWRKKVGRRVSGPEFGCLCGLVEVWPEGKAPEMLAMVIDHWDFFMAGAKIQMAEDSLRYFRYPSLTVIRRFPDVAREMLMMQEQLQLQKEKPVSPAKMNATLDLLGE